MRRGSRWKRLSSAQNGLVRRGNRRRSSLALTVSSMPCQGGGHFVTTMVHRARGFSSLEERCGLPLVLLAESRAGTGSRSPTDRSSHGDGFPHVAGVAWGIDEHGRRYSPSMNLSCGVSQAWAHVLHGALLPLRPRVELQSGEGLPNHRPPLVRAASTGLAVTGGAGAALSDSALEVVDPQRGQPAHADAVPRRRGAVGQPRQTLSIRRQRWGRGVQPKRRDGLPGNGLAPDPQRLFPPDVPRPRIATSALPAPSSSATAAALTTR